MRNSVLDRIRIAVLIGLASIGGVTLFAIYKDDGRIASSPFECEIYKALYERIVKPNNGTISRTTTKYVPPVGRLKPPNRFERFDERKEDFRLSTSGFFGATVALPDRDIGGCFDEPVAFWQSTQDDYLSNAGRVNNWTFSRVGTSRDGRYSLLFSRRVCGNLCAYARFYVLENDGDQWQIIAVQTEWIS